MKAKIIDFAVMIDRKQRLTLEMFENFIDKYEELKDSDVDLTIKKYREKRSIDANSYFHLLVNKIAENQKINNELCKILMVQSYGAIAKDENGKIAGAKIPVSVDIKKFYPYVKEFDSSVDENGIAFNHYLFYKRTRDLDSLEMSRLIDGVIYEAKELGIETMTPKEIQIMKERYINEKRFT